MLIKNSKYLYRNALKFIHISLRHYSNDGSIKSAGGKFAEMLAAHEGQYFHKKDLENLERIKEELGKGKTIDEIIEETKRELKAREECKKKAKKGEIDEQDCYKE